MSVPNGTRVLVLNDDYSPLNTVSWQQAIKKVLGESDCEHCYGRGNNGGMLCVFCQGNGVVPAAQVVEYYDIWFRDSKNREYAVPAVICNRHHVRTNVRKANFSKLNIFRRDGYRCQYCGIWYMSRDLTMDHVVPRSMWVGPDTPTNWHNIVTCCLPCNRKKGNRTPEQAGMPLRKKVNDQFIEYKRPKQPNTVELVLGLTKGNIAPEWEPYVKNFMTDQKLAKQS